MKFEDVKVKHFINKDDFEASKRYGLDGRIIRCYFKKTRGTYINGVFKCVKGTKVILEEQDLKVIMEAASKFRDTHTRRGEFIYLDEILVDLFPNKTMVIESCDLNIPVATIYSHKKYYNPDDDSTGWGAHSNRCNKSTFEFIIYDEKDFIECEKTAVELAKIKAEEDRKATEKVNTLCLKDAITAILNEAGININFVQNQMYFKGRTYVKANNKTAWNKLVILAINNYINSIVKEHGFTVAVPKIKETAKLNEYMPLFFLDELILQNEGEQK